MIYLPFILYDYFDLFAFMQYCPFLFVVLILFMHFTSYVLFKCKYIWRLPLSVLCLLCLQST